MVKKSRSNKGFTMAELLVVVAIIAVLVAVAIPVFSSQLKNARLAVDHSAMRDAYAVVQVANNTHDVVIDGVTQTFEQLDDELKASGYPFMTYYLSKDCSSIIRGYPWSPDSVYILQEDGEDSSGICHTCSQWDNALPNCLQPSQAHDEDSAIPITYVGESHQLYLGWGV